MNTNTENFSDPLAFCNYILPHVSRSFALGINALHGSLRKSVLVGYLLCRIADTIEDDLNLSSEKKCLYLEKFMNCFHSKEYFLHEISYNLTGNAFHILLVKNTPLIFKLFETLSDTSQAILYKWVHEMCLGMIEFIKKYPHGIRIASIIEYKKYCYYVAGTVGYMLTDFWKEKGIFITEFRYSQLKNNAGVFGEALQTINILKDIVWDKTQENSVYIPYGDNSIQEIIQLAETDLNIALEYVKNIPLINCSIRFFCIFPLLLAFATLREIKKSHNILNPEKKIKVSREETKLIYKNSAIACFSNFWLEKTAKSFLEKTVKT